jgi:hypothetical protein
MAFTPLRRCGADQPPHCGKELLSKISNPSAPIDAPRVDSAGSITPPSDPSIASFMASNLTPSMHPALRLQGGGQVAHPAQRIIDVAGGKLDRR